MTAVDEAKLNDFLSRFVPSALAQKPAVALGNQAGEARTRQILTEAGFTRFRHAAQTPFNLVYETRL